jgi:thiol-disulfide isomerase/thioredoxin/uncharacterized membrane protein YphA (DoxX/SURF4 family)
MEIFLLLARLILSLTFAFAGIAKLADQKGAEKSVVDFGAPESLARFLATLLSVTEIAAAILLLPLATAWIGASLAFGLLLIFITAIVYNMARGKAPDCHCFGQIYSEPIGWSVLIRNLILTAIAGFVVFAGRETAGLSAFAWLFDLTTGERMQLVFGLTICALLFGILFNLRNVLTNQRILQRQIEVLELTANETSESGERARREVEREGVTKPSRGLPVGAIAPNFAAPDINGKNVLLEHLLMRGRLILLFFVSPTCNPCKAMLPSIEKWANDFGSRISFVFISSGTAKENREKFAVVADLVTILLEKERNIAKLFRSQWTPGAVLLNADGTIGSELATGDKEIFNLIDSISFNFTNSNGSHSSLKNIFLTRPRPDSFATKIGEAFPNFVLPSLDGKNVSFEEFRGMKTVLLFWRETCPFCREMAADLRRWEAEQNEFRLVIVAKNEPEVVALRQFQSTVLLETDLEVQRAMDFDGTPGAVVLDENGTIISEYSTSAENVFALVGKYKNDL